MLGSFRNGSDAITEVESVNSKLLSHIAVPKFFKDKTTSPLQPDVSHIATAAAADILHLVEHEKFIPAFINLIADHLNSRRHHFFFIHNGHRYTPQGGEIVTRNAAPTGAARYLLSLARELNRADKIVLHGLFNSRLILLLFLQPWLLHKCYWIIWGGDLYTYAINEGGSKWRLKEWFRRPLIRRFGHLVTYVPGDVELARQWYGARGQYHECLVYPSNTYHHIELPDHHHEGLQILVGNSADRSNEHIEVLQKLQAHRDTPLKVFVPLSYGDNTYAEAVIEQGQRLLGDRLVPLRDFMPYDAYLRLLGGIDIAIFNHRRQQGMGNIIALLGMGKTVYLRSDTTSWKALTGMGLRLGDTLAPELHLLTPEAAAANRAIISSRFSESVLVDQLRVLMEN